MQRSWRVLYVSQLIEVSTRCTTPQIARPRDGQAIARHLRCVSRGWLLCPLKVKTAPLAQLQRRQSDHREDQRDDPEADDDLRFCPALVLVVVMDRCHQEDALAGALEIDHLNDHR